MTDFSGVLDALKARPVENAWAIQDLTLWPDRSKFHGSQCPKGLSYLLITGHPSQGRNTTILMDDAGGELADLLRHLPQSPFVIRETKADVLPVLQQSLPQNAVVYLEQRMQVARETFKPVLDSRARRLQETDAIALARYHGAPPQAAERAAEGLKQWLRGAVIMAVFEGADIVALGTSIVRTKDAWILAGIETKADQRGKGYATHVTSALTEEALRHAPVVSLTVLKDNPPAIKVYSKLGYEAKEDRIWVDNGVGAKP